MISTNATPVTEEYLERGDGMRIFVRSWRPLSRPSAVVVICHGVNSHSGQYFWAAEQLVAAGYAVYALDLRGRGKSDGDRFFIESVTEYADDLSTLVQLAKGREPGLPIFLLGHSAGGVVSATYTLEHQAELAGFICESFAFQVYAPDFALAVLKGLSHVAPHLHVLRLKNEDFSRDPAIVASMNSDPLIDNEVQPTSTVAALVRADERLKRDFPLITLPVFILHGTADKATKPAGSQLFFDTTGSSDKTLKLYPGHFHDLLNDLGREEVMAEVLGWIGARLPVEKTAAAAG
ncbi:alpha/beta hydrolase [Mesorhizobium sp.]|uniref:alpha/beta hydrolase n=1 Tax=Mesorhizobium sp. TaxID=1871066 RepID=UPI000FE9C52C|nr:alpha/beta hydrolase [Mesorhizobium sp.]RWC59958.1 MAG: alpha/beta hydrolase [Mesorhizobium sp.]RWC66094.1 MAG: alpha/beta hydrolase [Mesorhizobium sp.]